MKATEARRGHSYDYVDHGRPARVTLIDLIRSWGKPARARILIQDRAVGGGRRHTSSEAVPIREVSIRSLHQ